MKNLFLWLLFLTPIFVCGQSKVEKLLLKPKSSRLVWSVNFNPLNVVYNKNTNKFGNKLGYSQNEKIMTGIRVERYSPLSRIDYGLDLNFNYDNYDMTSEQKTYRFNETSVDFTPFITLKTGLQVKNTKHLFINIGVTNRYFIERSVSFEENSQISIDKKDWAVRKFRMSGYVGLGLIIDKAYTKMWDNPKPFGQDKIYFGLNFPFFNQAYVFNYNVPSNNYPLEKFHKSKLFPYVLSFHFTRNIDLYKNGNESANLMLNRRIKSQDTCCRVSDKNESFSKPFRIMPLIVHQNRSGAYLGLYQRLIYHQRLDSLSIKTSSSEFVYNRTGSVSFRGGISYHFLSNRRPIIIRNEPRIYRDVYITLGSTQLVYLLETKDGFAKTIQTSVDVGQGLRFGTKKFYVAFGARYSKPLKNLIFFDEKKEKLVEFSGHSNFSGFLGFGFRNSIYVGVEYRKIKTIQRNNPNNILNYLALSVGFGL